jgi:ParB family chromosome partitioning protein
MMGHARTLINIDDPKKQINVYYQILDGELSVRQSEELVRQLQTEKVKDPEKVEKKKKINDDFSRLSDHLHKIFDAKVNFRINENGKGKIVIQFDDQDEMERILSVFDRLNS